MAALAEEYLSPEGLAERLGVSVSTVYEWNRTGTGPDRYKVGRHVRYDMNDVARWLESRKANGLEAAAR